MICKHCKEPIRPATDKEKQFMLIPPETRRYKHIGSDGVDTWLCDVKDRLLRAEPAEPERFKTPAEELDRSMIEGRDGWQLMRSAIKFHFSMPFPSTLDDPYYPPNIDEMEAYHLLLGCCIEIAKENSKKGGPQ